MPKKHPNIYYYIIIYNILSCGLETLDISAEKTSESLPPSQGIITFGNGHWGSVLVYTPPPGRSGDTRVLTTTIEAFKIYASTHCTYIYIHTERD